jgi:S1-C subfamily serine protease
MDIEQLTKMQIVLLTLLVSFVTSIATGIVTVTLVDQAPPAVTQTINRVVERTIESVVPEDKQGAVVGEVVTKEIIKEVQVVVRESDLVSDSVAKIGKSLVRIYTLNEQVGSGSEGKFLGLGLVISRDGLVVTDSTLVEPARFYVVKTAVGASYRARLKNESPARSTAVLEMSIPSGEEVIFPPVAFADLATLKLGQSVAMLGGKERNAVSIGIVSDFIEGDIDGVETIKTSVNAQPAILGAPLIDLFGEVLGIYTADGSTVSGISYTANNVVKEQLDEIFATIGN